MSQESYLLEQERPLVFREKWESFPGLEVLLAPQALLPTLGDGWRAPRVFAHTVRQQSPLPPAGSENQTEG